MRARDQSSIFSTGGKFRPDYGLLLELHALTLVARFYALLTELAHMVLVFSCRYIQFLSTSLIPRPHPLMRRNNLVNQASEQFCDSVTYM